MLPARVGSLSVLVVGDGREVSRFERAAAALHCVCFFALWGVLNGVVSGTL